MFKRIEIDGSSSDIDRFLEIYHEYKSLTNDWRNLIQCNDYDYSIRVQDSLIEGYYNARLNAGLEFLEYLEMMIHHVSLSKYTYQDGKRVYLEYDNDEVE